MRRLTRPKCGWFLAAVFLLTSCTTTVGRPVPVSGSASTIKSSAGTAWTATGLTAVTQPVLAGGVTLLYAQLHGKFAVVAVDPASGDVRWSAAAHGGNAAPLPDLEVAAVNDRVVFLRGEASGPAQIVVADAATGKDISVSSGPYVVDGMPRRCGTEVCLTIPKGRQFENVRVQPATGAISVDPPGTVDATSELGSGLRLINRAGRHFLVSPGRLAVAFQVSVGTVVPANREINESRLYAGTFVVSLVRPLERQSTTDAYGTEVGLVGVDAATGRLRWSSAGADMSCLPLGLRIAQQPLRCHWGPTARGRCSRMGVGSSWT